MRVRRSSSAIVLAPIALLIAGTAVRTIADTGGGSGKPETPYARSEEVTAAVVAEVKHQAGRARDAERIPLRNAPAAPASHGIGLAFCRDGVPATTPTFEFRGTGEDGSTPLTVDMSEVDTFSVVSYEEKPPRSDRVLVEVVQFPAISAEKLVETRPTYTALHDGYTRTQRLWLAAQNDVGELCIVRDASQDRGDPFLEGEEAAKEGGAKRKPPGAYELTALTRDIEPKHAIQLGYGPIQGSDRRGPAIWWAIESVIADKAYPHRVFFAY